MVMNIFYEPVGHWAYTLLDMLGFILFFFFFLVLMLSSSHMLSTWGDVGFHIIYMYLSLVLLD